MFVWNCGLMAHLGKVPLLQNKALAECQESMCSLCIGWGVGWGS